MSAPSPSFLAGHSSNASGTSRQASSFSPSSPLGGYLSSHPHSAGRFEADFVQLAVLGRGTFGQVIKAQNKVDNVVYAIKRIRIKADSADAERKIIREVSTLSRLSHPHIVRYFQAWFEDSDRRMPRNETDTDDESDADEPSRGSAYSMGAAEDDVFFYDEHADVAEMTVLPPTPDRSRRSKRGSRGRQVVLTCALCGGHYEDWEVLLEQWQLVRSSLHSLCLCRACFVGDLQGQGLGDIVRHIRFQAKAPPAPMFLFIQMEYCQSTLRAVIDSGQLGGRERLVWRLFEQIVDGLAYIHEQNMIHRDLKPDNIFLSGIDALGRHGLQLDERDYGRISVKIGDFGLAKELEPMPSPSESIDAQTWEHIPTSPQGLPTDDTSEVGTFLYSSEAKDDNGRSSGDMYSVGIVLFEMLHPPFATQMERVHTLQLLRRSQSFPHDFDKVHFEASIIIRRLVHHDAFRRPAARELLRMIGEMSVRSVAMNQAITRRFTAMDAVLGPSSVPASHADESSSSSSLKRIDMEFPPMLWQHNVLAMQAVGDRDMLLADLRRRYEASTRNLCEAGFGPWFAADLESEATASGSLVDSRKKRPADLFGTPRSADSSRMNAIRERMAVQDEIIALLLKRLESSVL